MMDWAVKKALKMDTKSWVIIVLLILLFIGGGVAGTMLVLRKRRYGKLVHEKNVLEEEKLAARAEAELASNDAEREKLVTKQAELTSKAMAVDGKVDALEKKHGRVKLALEGVTSWDDLRIEK